MGLEGFMVPVETLLVPSAVLVDIVLVVFFTMFIDFGHFSLKSFTRTHPAILQFSWFWHPHFVFSWFLMLLVIFRSSRLQEHLLRFYSFLCFYTQIWFVDDCYWFRYVFAQVVYKNTSSDFTVFLVLTPKSYLLMIF